MHIICSQSVLNVRNARLSNHSIQINPTRSLSPPIMRLRGIVHLSQGHEQNETPDLP
ncbi:hypothetical protein VFPPC_17068 [Pochonia chlamydosporia 170]|uniref:Uncharacterized protein n=1 Tax=Pochonia chlamydosporia 170 TaxID=1380566 RepID=A0A179EXZ8_METCM|nr:hypothetical protein VFPPC_17068 [Pochonia chlamydosporia 170]OAQ57880.1 hypothetical protein VFPPC_17068 [Pochonia chlamydosporia 170]